MARYTHSECTIANEKSYLDVAVKGSFREVRRSYEHCLVICHHGLSVKHSCGAFQVEEAARIAGARRSRVLMRIIVPLMAPGLIASFLFAFLISFDEPIVALFLARHDVTTLPPRILTYLRFRSDPTVAAVSTIMSLLAVAAILVIDRLVGLDRIFGLTRSD